ncbi:MAG: hypothetical protein A2Y33_11270 [Spirochaetes bacterium GWF1_51_8]|nr:MAG: hypothetical protein A2Y33_11270 [Spirochaetes bacterium GWF1_51_8]
MKKLFVFSLIIGLFTSCSLFFIGDNYENKIVPLAVSGGGNLSTDSHNEISPFLFRGSDGTVLLFFASDRLGSYDIYVSRMNSGDEFSVPAKLPFPVNGDNTYEAYPVVHESYPNLKVTLLKISNSVTNIYTYTIDTNFISNLATFIVYESPKGLGMIRKTYENLLLLPKGIKSVGVYGSINGEWDMPGSTNLMNDVFALNAISIQTNNMNGDTIDLYIAEIVTGGKHQLAAEGWVKSGYFTNTVIQQLNISSELYSSAYNDITPFIDYQGGFKVYFASDRYGKGNYDLYRYNIYTYNKLPEVQQLFAWDTQPPLLNPYYPTNGQIVSIIGFSISVSVTNSSGIELSGGVDVFCSLDDEAFVEMSEDGDWSRYFSGVSAGIHTLRVYGVDAFRNISPTYSITVSVQ